MLFRPLAFLILACCCSAQAAEIKTMPFKQKPGEGIIIVNGIIKYEDKQKFLNTISRFSGGVVVFNSRGGSAVAGMGIGLAIRMRGFATWVPSGSFCASACAIAWLGGTRRLMGKTALIGFHSVYKLENGKPVTSGVGNAVYGAYLSRLGLSDQAIVFLSNATPTSMNWLTPIEAQSFGIGLKVFDPKTKQAAAAPGAPAEMPGAPAAAPGAPNAMPGAPNAGDPEPAGNLESRSRTFVIALNVVISGPTQRYLKVLNGLYADQVLYFGKKMQHADVVDQLTKFAARWPIRSYVVRPRSLKVRCDAQTSTCHVSGLIDFDVKSPARKQRSHGVESVDYSLAFRPGVKLPVIVNEGGRVVNGKVEALRTVPPPAANDMGLARQAN
jgi:hypothetical protein